MCSGWDDAWVHHLLAYSVPASQQLKALSDGCLSRFTACLLICSLVMGGTAVAEEAECAALGGGPGAGGYHREREEQAVEGAALAP